MKKIIIVLAAATSTIWLAGMDVHAHAQSFGYTPPAAAAYINPSGSGWAAWSAAAGFGALTYTPSAIGLYCQASAGTAWTPCAPSGSGGTGTVTSFSSGNLSPLFTTSVATPTVTPAQTFTASTAAQGAVLAGPVSGGTGAYSFRALTSTDIPTLSGYLPAAPATSVLGQRIASGWEVVFDGDSLTAGVGTVGPTTRWSTLLLALPEWASKYSGTANNAVSGQTCEQRVAAYPTQGHLVSPSVTGTPGIYFIWVGTNDLAVESAATTYTCISGFWSTLKTDGWTVVASTLHGTGSSEPGSPNIVLARQVLNDSIRSAGATSTTYDYLMDPDTIYHDPHNLTWMQSDFTHPNVAGNAYYAQYVNALIWSHGFMSGTPGPQPLSGMGTGVGNYRTSQLSMYSMSTGAYNTAGGLSALAVATATTGATAFGYGACAAMTGQLGVTCLGYASGTVATAQRFTGVGYQSGSALLGGADNTFLGYISASTCTTCSQSVAVGSGTVLATTSANQIAIGYQATSTAANSAIIGNSSITATTLQGTISSGNSGVLNMPVVGSETVASSATPTFSVNFGTSYNVLTANVTSFTLAAGADGQQKKLCFKQGATPYTVTPPANVHGFFTVGVTASDYSCQEFVYNLVNSIWLATSAGVINQ